MTTETETLRAIARAILARGALIVNPEKPVRWSSGYAMPVYTDNRCLIGYPDVRAAIGEAFADAIKKSGLHHDAIAGVATGGIPHATTLADRLKLPLLYVRPKPKDHGQGRQVEGDIPGGIAGKNVLVIEDLISTGGSIANAAEALRREGALVTNCRSIFYYDIPGRKSKIEEMNPPCAFASLVTFPFLLQVATAEELLPKETIKILHAWFESPFTWGEEHGMPPLAL